MDIRNPRTETARVVKEVFSGRHETNGALIDALIVSLLAEHLIYSSREEYVRSAISRAVNGRPWNERREATCDHVRIELLNSGEIIGSWNY